VNLREAVTPSKFLGKPFTELTSLESISSPVVDKARLDKQYIFFQDIILSKHGCSNRKPRFSIALCKTA
jgi:hypothetical protein